MQDPDLWRWIWLGATATFAVGEIVIAGSFFLAPFAVGALVATILAFAGTDLAVQWAGFVVVSAAAFGAMRPLARRLDRSDSGDGVGAKRLLGQHATVLEPIPRGHELGLVQVHREQWRAQSIDGSSIAAGSAVKVVEVRGTRVIVAPVLGPPHLDAAPDPDRST